MKCTSCVSSRATKSDDDDDADDVEEASRLAASSSRAMEKIEEEYRVDSPPTILEGPSTPRAIPSVSIVEVSQDYRGESSRMYDIALEGSPGPSSNSSAHLLRPLDVITEETSDVSDSENRPPPPKPDLCFPRPKARFKKAKSRNLLKTLLQPKQEPTTCVLVDAKIAESAPEEYRSVCTTEVVPEEILEVEVIDLGSNSSSLADLTDIDDLEENPPTRDNELSPSDVIDETQHDQDKINNNDNDSDPAPLEDVNEFRNRAPTSATPHRDDNDNEIDSESSLAVGVEKEQEQVYSEEDNNHYDGYDENTEAAAESRESKTSEIFTQTHATTQNDDDDDDDDDASDDDGCHENDRTESDRDWDDDLRRTSTSLAADVDRTGEIVVTQHRNVIEVKECDPPETESKPIDRDSVVVTHRHGSSSSGEEDHQSLTGDFVRAESQTIEMTDESVQVPKPPPPIPLPPPPNVAVPTRPTTSVAPSRPPPPPPPPSSSSSSVDDDVTNLGQDDIGDGSSTVERENAQIHSGSYNGEVDSANADQNSAQDSVDAVIAAEDGDLSDSSVLLKFLQDSQPPAEAENSVENRPTFGDRDQNDEKSQQNLPATTAATTTTTKIEHTVKSDQLNYEIVQDHHHQRVLREETVTTAATAAAASTGEVILRRRGSRQPFESRPKEPSPEQKAALVHDLRNEISRIKDAELQEEFRKLELEAARIEEELGKIGTSMPTSIQQHPPAPPSHSLQSENLTYYVSKQNDFAVERPPPPRSKPPPPVAIATKPTSSVAKSSSNDQLYNEWQQKMEEREARRLHKVIQLSKTPSDAKPVDPSAEEDEFHRKVKDRRRKFTFPNGGSEDSVDSCGSAPNSTPATPVSGRKPIPKHIEAEFAEFAEIRKRQQQEQEQEGENVEDGQSRVESGTKAAETSAGELPAAGDGTIDQRPPGLLVLASAIGIVVWSVCRVLFGRK